MFSPATVTAPGMAWDIPSGHLLPERLFHVIPLLGLHFPYLGKADWRAGTGNCEWATAVTTHPATPNLEPPALLYPIQTYFPNASWVTTQASSTLVILASAWALTLTHS